MTVTWDLSDSVHLFFNIDILCDVTIFFVSDVLQFYVCKMELMFLRLEECSEMNQCIIHLGQSKQLCLLWKSGENVDQILSLVSFSPWIKKYHLVLVFIHLCSYPSLTSTRLICVFSSCTWDFVLSGISVLTISFWHLAKKSMTQIKIYFPATANPGHRWAQKVLSSNLLEQGSFLFFLWLNQYHSLWHSWEFRASANAEVMYISIGLIWEFYFSRK